jgi:hypothetical protein
MVVGVGADVSGVLPAAIACYILKKILGKKKERSSAFGVKWSEFLAADPQVRAQFPALPDFLKSSGYGTGSTQPREYN